MKIKDLSLTSKLLFGIGTIGLLFALGIYLGADYLLTQNSIMLQRQVNKAELRNIEDLLQRWEQKLRATGSPEVYRKQFQTAVIEDLYKHYYSELKDISPYPLIIDDMGLFLLHPTFPPGSYLTEVAPQSLSIMLDQQAGELHYEFHSQDKWIEFNYFAPWGWTIGYTVTKDYMFQYRDQFRKLYLLIMVISGILAMALLSFLAQWIMLPIRDMTQAALEIKNGNLNYKIKTDYHGEIKILAQQFSSMQKSLRNKIEELEQIIHVASHDLRSPLVNILGFSGELRQSLNEVEFANPEERKELLHFAHFIDSSAKRLDMLIKGILAVSRLERTHVTFQPIHSFELLQQALQQFEFPSAEKGITLSINSSAEWPKISGANSELFQLFTNLISNAIRYSDPEKSDSWIRVSTTKRKNPINKKMEIGISVADNGLGIDPRYHKKIFEIFHRLELKKPTEGEGIGLAICTRIAQRHHASIEVDSNLGQGATFTVWFPLSSPRSL